MKKTFILSIVSMLFIALSFTACEDAELSSSVDQNRIYTNYELFYNSNEDVTYARASFRFGNSLGTLLELDGTSEVSFNGDVLSKEEEPITNFLFYEKAYSGFVDNGTFTWVDNDGNNYENTIQINTIDYPDSIGLIARDSSYEMFWQGDSLAADESVTILINGDSEGDAKTFTQDADNSTSIILQEWKLEGLPVGEADFWMDRTYQPDLNDATEAGGRIKGRYRPDNISVFFE